LIWEIAACLYCGSPLRFAVTKQVVDSPERTGTNSLGEDPYEFTLLTICSTCGWYKSQTYCFWVSPIFPVAVGTSALFLKRELTASDLPIGDLRSHLMRNWGDRKLITARQAESLVADVFRDLLDGEVFYTSNGVYAPDGGIDFVLIQTASGIEYAFQIKRRLTDRPECVEPVRAFLGSVASSRYSHGFYVTTSPRFTSVVRREIEDGGLNLARHDLKVDIIDGTQLYAFLKAGSTSSTPFADLRQRFGSLNGSWYEVSSLSHYADFFELWKPPHGPGAKECVLEDILRHDDA